MKLSIQRICMIDKNENENNLDRYREEGNYIARALGSCIICHVSPGRKQCLDSAQHGVKSYSTKCTDYIEKNC